MADAQAAEQPGKALRLVAGTVLGRDALDSDAEAPVVADGLDERPTRAAARFIGMHGARCQPGGCLLYTSPSPRD